MVNTGDTNIQTGRAFGLQKRWDAQFLFLGLSGLILLLTASAKLVSVGQTLKILLLPDPVFPFLTTRELLQGAAVLELATVSAVILSSNNTLKLAAIAWLSSLFLLYRLGLLLVHAPLSYCPCLGSVGGAVVLSDHALSKITFITAAFLWVGASALLIRGRWKPC